MYIRYAYTYVTIINEKSRNLKESKEFEGRKEKGEMM